MFVAELVNVKNTVIGQFLFSTNWYKLLKFHLMTCCINQTQSVGTPSQIDVLFFSYVEVESLSPTRGSLAGGTKITIKGTGEKKSCTHMPHILSLLTEL